MASINYEHSLDEKILVIYEHDSFDDIQEALLTWCCHQYINCTFKVYFNNYSHELIHIGFVKLSYTTLMLNMSFSTSLLIMKNYLINGTRLSFINTYVD
ncbi:hypothetical protein [Photobacterium toruni]|uniref:Uncharacterized protein n=1 Tax=Photobacterium toruni TaxID=1935446 RepID=A0A1T4UUI0_9GAMM|nr:hypothetical protein [Photobacterium toruni]SKA56278.1 hypothetical protein CZ814_03723 [Photobacterium toruni]